MHSPRRNEPIFEFWISFWPIAPMFGVPWRFGKMMPGADLLAATAFVAPAEAKQAAPARPRPARPAPVEDAEIVGTSPTPAAKAAEPAPAAEPAAAAKADEPAAAPEAAAPEAVAPAPAKDLFTADAAPDAIAAPATLYAEAPALVDDLKQIKGVGPKLETMLNNLGIYRFDQIAAFSEANLAWVDDKLTVFKGRPLRDDWVAQARALL